MLVIDSQTIILATIGKSVGLGDVASATVQGDLRICT